MLRAETRGHNSQRALLKQVSPGLQRIFLRAKRKPAPSTQAVRSRSLTGAGGFGSEGRERKVVVGEMVLAEAGRCAGPFGRRGIARLWGPIASGFLSGKVFGRRGIARLCVGELIYKKMRVSGW